MKLGNIIRDHASPIEPRKVTFWVVGRDKDLAQVKAKATAVLVYLNEDQRSTLRVEAYADLSERFPDKEIPPGVAADEQLYRKLFEVVRDETPNEKGIFTRFADTLLEFRAALTLEQARHIEEEYNKYIDVEFPSEVSDADFKSLVEEAKKKSCSDLLTSCGYASATRVLSFLAAGSST